jgi:hypothetical protein
MPSELAALTSTLLYLLPGLAFLILVRMVELRAAAVIAALGLAYLVGMSLVVLLTIALMVAGLPATTSGFVLLSAVLTVVFGVLAWRRRPKVQIRSSAAGSERRSLRSHFADRPAAWWVALITLGAIAVLVYGGYISSVNKPVAGWDGWTMWLRKAIMIDHSHGLPTSFLTSPEYGFTHPDYPMLIPVWMAQFFGLVGHVDSQAVHGQFWILYVAGLWAAGSLAHRAAPPVGGSRLWAGVIWLPVLGLLLVSSYSYGKLMTLLADVPLGVFTLVAGMAAASWLAERRSSQLWTTAVLLAAVASTKNEGLPTVVAMLGALLLIALFSDKTGERRATLLSLGAATGLIVLLTLPWRIWASAHGLKSDIPVLNGLSPVHLWDHHERFQPALVNVSAQLLDTTKWWAIPAIALALIVACLLIGVSRRVAGFYLAVMTGTFLAPIWVYTITDSDLAFYFESSVSRVVVSCVMISAAAVLHLSARIAASGIEQPAERRDDEEPAKAPVSRRPDAGSTGAPRDG